ncbi:hypothetical protein MUK42_01973, partial [Musa troglodytarum]
RCGSQEKDNSRKRIFSLAPIASTREESQLHLSRAAGIVCDRMQPLSQITVTVQVSEELVLKLQLIERSINRVGMILDSVQGDVMKVNKAIKELPLEGKPLWTYGSLFLMLKTSRTDVYLNLTF